MEVSAQYQHEQLSGRLAAIAEDSRDAIVALDLKFTVLAWNRAAERIHGYTAEEMIGRNISVLVPDSRRDELTTLHKALMSGETIRNFETERRKKDGQTTPVALTLSTIRGSAGEVIGISAIVRDLSKRRDRLRRLEESESRFRALAEASFEAILLETEGRVIEVNAAFLHIFGCREDEVVGHPLSVVLGEAEPLVAGEDRREIEIRRCDGGTRFLEARGKTISYRDRNVRVIAMLDITERRQSFAELDRFAHIVSHDLREPLRMVSSFVTLLSRKYQGRLDRDADEFIAFAVDGAQRARRLIDSLLTYSRAAKTRAPLHEVSLDEILAQVLADLKLTIDANQAVVSQDQLPTVRADGVQLSQLFQNLISNAIRFRGVDAPRIHIGSERRDGGWCVSVRDNGVGINIEYTDHLFRLFPRVHQEDNFPSTGVGLAICRRIVERHGGRIWAESEEGKGSVFYFTVPITA